MSNKERRGANVLRRLLQNISGSRFGKDHSTFSARSEIKESPVVISYFDVSYDKGGLFVDLSKAWENNLDRIIIDEYINRPVLKSGLENGSLMLVINRYTGALDSVSPGVFAALKNAGNHNFLPLRRKIERTR